MNIDIDDAIDKARRIRGWCEPPDLRFLATSAAVSHVTIEVGVWRGRSLRCLCDASPGLVIGVDHWMGGPSSSARVMQLQTKPGFRQKIMEQARHNLHCHIESGKLIMLEMASVDAATFVRQLVKWRGGADMIYLDADHEFFSVMTDIHHWKPILKPGGLFCGHDREWPGVIKALDTSLPGWKPAARRCWSWTKQ